MSNHFHPGYAYDPPPKVYRTKNEPDGSTTHWESRDNGYSWTMTRQVWPEKNSQAMPPPQESRTRAMLEWLDGELARYIPSLRPLWTTKDKLIEARALNNSINQYGLTPAQPLFFRTVI